MHLYDQMAYNINSSTYWDLTTEEHATQSDCTTGGYILASMHSQRFYWVLAIIAHNFWSHLPVRKLTRLMHVDVGSTSEYRVSETCAESIQSDRFCGFF